MTWIPSRCSGSSGTGDSILAPHRLPREPSARYRVGGSGGTDIPAVQARRHPNMANGLGRALLVFASRRWEGDKERGGSCISMRVVAVHPAADCDVRRLCTAARPGGRGLWHRRTPLRPLLLHPHRTGVDDQTQQQKGEHRRSHGRANDNGRRNLAIGAAVTRPASEPCRENRRALRLRSGG